MLVQPLRLLLCPLSVSSLTPDTAQVSSLSCGIGDTMNKAGTTSCLLPCAQVAMLKLIRY